MRCYDSLTIRKIKSFNPRGLVLSDARQPSLCLRKSGDEKGFERHLVHCSWLGPEYRNPFIWGGGGKEGGGTLSKWIHLCEPVNTNSSFRKREKINKERSDRKSDIVGYRSFTSKKKKYSSHCAWTTSSKCSLHTSSPSRSALLGFLRQHNTSRRFQAVRNWPFLDTRCRSGAPRSRCITVEKTAPRRGL